MDQAIAAIRAMLDARTAGESAKVIEGQAAEMEAPKPVKRLKARRDVGPEPGKTDETAES